MVEWHQNDSHMRTCPMWRLDSLTVSYCGSKICTVCIHKVTGVKVWSHVSAPRLCMAVLGGPGWVGAIPSGCGGGSDRREEETTWAGTFQRISFMQLVTSVGHRLLKSGWHYRDKKKLSDLHLHINCMNYVKIHVLKGHCLHCGRHYSQLRCFWLTTRTWPKPWLKQEPTLLRFKRQWIQMNVIFETFLTNELYKCFQFVSVWYRW